MSICPFDRWTTQWVSNWLDCCTQRVAVTSSMFKWRSATSDVPHGSVLGSALFNVFIGDTDCEFKCTLSKFDKDSKLCSSAGEECHQLEGRNAIQRDLERIERWAFVNLMKFNKAKYNILHLVWGNPKHKY